MQPANYVFMYIILFSGTRVSGAQPNGERSWRDHELIPATCGDVYHTRLWR